MNLGTEYLNVSYFTNIIVVLYSNTVYMID